MRHLMTPYGDAIVKEGQYSNGRLALQLLDAETDEPIAVLTVNLPDEDLGAGEFFVKTWSENEQVAAYALLSGLFKDTGRRIPTGFADAQVWCFAPKAPDRPNSAHED